MANNIIIKDGNDVSRTLHTVEDSTSAHFNQSIPTDVSGHVASIVSGAGQAAQSGMGGLVVALHPSSPVPAGTNFIGAVSVRGNVSIDDKVSVAGRVSAHQDGTWDVNASVVGLVSINGPLPAGTNLLGKVSIADSIIGVSVKDSTLAITQSGPWRVSVTDPLPAGTNLIGAVSIRGNILGSVSISNIADVSVQDNAPVSVRGGVLGAVSLGGGTAIIGKVSLAGINPVSVAGNIPGIDSAITVGTHAVTQSGTWTVQPGNTANTTPWLVSIGGNVSLSDNAPVSVRGGVLGAVSLGGGTAIIGKVSLAGINPVSVAGNIPGIDNAITVGTHAVTQSGTWTVQPGNTANTTPWLVSVGGNVSLSDNAPVSVRGGRVSIADSTLVVTQSGTWTVQPGNTANTTPWLVSVGGNVSLSDNAPVSVRGGVLGAVSLGGGTAQIGRVSVFVDQVPFNVSVMNSLPVPVSIVAGKVSIQGISQVSVAGSVTVAPPTNTGAAVGAGAFFVGGTDGANLRGLLTDASGRLVVHVSNTAPGGAAGSTQVVSIGGAVSNQAVQIAFTDGTNARTPLVNTGGNILVHVCNAQPTPSGITQMVSIDGAVSTQAVQVAFTDGTNAKTPLVDVSGVIRTTGYTFTSQYIFTRPADTTAYAGPTAAFPGTAGDLIANSTTNTAVVPLKFKVARVPGGIAYIRRARLFRTGTAAAANIHNVATALRLHIFNTTNEVSVATGDNVAMKASPVSVYRGHIDLLLPVSVIGIRTGGGTSVAYYQGVPAGSSEIICHLSSNQVSIQALLESRGAWTPISGEIFTTQLDVFQ